MIHFKASPRNLIPFGNPEITNMNYRPTLRVRYPGGIKCPIRGIEMCSTPHYEYLLQNPSAMKSIFALFLISLSICLPLSAQPAAPKPPDAFEEGMRQAFAAYKKGDDEAVTAKLRELLKIMDEKGAAKLGASLPDMAGTWKGEALKTEDASALGAGAAIARTYVSGDKRITVRVVKDSPLVAQLLPILVNEELLKMSGRTIHKISGETAVMEGDSKLQIVVDQRIYLELAGENGAGETDLVSLAEKLDLAGIAKIK